MKYSLSISDKTKTQIINAIEWYEELVPKSQDKFLKLISKSIDYINKNPFKCQVRYKNIRIQFLKTPKFGIHYFIEENHIYVIGFFHTNQDSEKWY